MPSGDRARAAELPLLFSAIAGGDVTRVSELLVASPTLASDVALTGATRAAAAAFYLDEIAHYVYAGDTALHLAAAAHQPNMVRDLIARHATVRAKNRRGAEPLHYACDGNPSSARWNPSAQAETIDCLIAAGADVDAADKSGVTPLHRAVRTRCAEAVRVLLEHGANARKRNGRGSTPMQLAVRTTGRGGSGSTEAREQQAEIVRLLLAHGARATE